MSASWRNWRGYVLNDQGKIVRMTKEYPTPAAEHVKMDIYHNLVEIPHMAKFLPQLYAEESNKPVDAY